MSTRPGRTAAERSASVVEDPSWKPGLPFRPEYTHNGSGTVDELLHDYDQWQVRIARWEDAHHVAGVDTSAQIYEMNRRMRRLTGELVAKVRTERNVNYDDPDWEPTDSSERHPAADGPSITEMVDDYDRWNFRSQSHAASAVSGGQDPYEAMGKIDAQMGHLVHELVHRIKLMSRR